MRLSDLTPELLEPWIELRFSRSSGPGGQHVNKLSTRAELLFDFHACTLLSPEQRRRIATRLAARLSRDGRLRIVSQAGRSAGRNRGHAADRLIELLRTALHVPRTRQATKPTAGSRQRRLLEKKQRSDVKRARRSPPVD